MSFISYIIMANKKWNRIFMNLHLIQVFVSQGVTNIWWALSIISLVLNCIAKRKILKYRVSLKECMRCQTIMMYQYFGLLIISFIDKKWWIIQKSQINNQVRKMCLSSFARKRNSWRGGRSSGLRWILKTPIPYVIWLVSTTSHPSLKYAKEEKEKL